MATKLPGSEKNNTNTIRNIINNHYANNNTFLILRYIIEEFWTKRKEFQDEKQIKFQINNLKYNDKDLKIKKIFTLKRFSLGPGSDSILYSIEVNGKDCN